MRVCVLCSPISALQLCDYFISHLLTTVTLHHTFTISKLTFSRNRFHHSLLAPTWTAFSDYTGPDLLCSTVFRLDAF